MTTPQLTGMTNFNGTSNTVTKEEIDFQANLMSFKLPLSTAEGGINTNLGFFPKQRIIRIAGVFSDPDEADQKSFIDEFIGGSGWINAGNISTKTYTTRHNHSYTVKCNGFKYITTEATPVHIEWEAELWTEA